MFISKFFLLNILKLGCKVSVFRVFSTDKQVTKFINQGSGGGAPQN